MIFEDYVPHSGPMALLDEIQQVGDGNLVAEVTLSSESVFASSTGVPAWVGIEYMAQAIGAYSGFKARSKEEPIKIGFLVGTRKYQSHVDEFALNSKLLVSVDELMEADNGLFVFSCRINAAAENGNPGDLLAEANLNVYQPNSAEEIMQR